VKGTRDEINHFVIIISSSISSYSGGFRVETSGRERSPSEGPLVGRLVAIAVDMRTTIIHSSNDVAPVCW